MPATHHVIGGSDGWLNVKREPSGQVVSLPEFLQVELQSSAGGRDRLKVLEGPEAGRLFSVKVGHLKPGLPGFRGAASLRFDLSRKLVSYSGGQVSAITDANNPVPVGSHPIQIPDFPHELGAGYTAQSPYAKTWFYLGTGNAVSGNNDRYLHAGSVSAGCITVAPSAWTALYRYLILCRSGNAKTVGTVVVSR